MNNFTEINPHKLTMNPFRKIGKQWMLITAGDEQNLNTMTASWGGLGVMWNKDAAFIFVRPSRYTYEFLEKAENFSLCFFGEEQRQALNICGTKSGRDGNKIAEAGLTPVVIDGTPCFDEAEEILICRKMYAQPMNKEFALSNEVTKHYGEDEPYHIMYVGEVIKALKK